ncbi:glycosyltransferase family protein [Mucilaginibacter arboris]|uniref:Glycosyl transferase n=1 Tax=Mucilaginibacter arboris TaxID=2682090 RepID=A0A7K1SRR4_9SPHI|nr:glycosyltransferase family protein [Mucilaginibacter arboris]MVN19991.1 glycosyl transferase [Mucilaginibacter arboris]
MKILFAIQGTGNGHISRAREIVPLLQQYGELDLLISGTQADVSLSQPLKYKLHGFSFIFGKKGGVDYWKTFKVMNLRQLLRDIRSLPLKQYDLILNDFEPVSAWACKLQKLESVSLSHQCAFISPNTPRPKKWNYAEWLFKYYAPATHHVGFHFERYADFIHTPVIRSEIRNMEIRNLGHYTVYLPAYHDQFLLSYLKQVKEVQWQIFSKHTQKEYTDGNVLVKPVQNAAFNQSLATAAGLLTGGGFEGPAETLFMHKKVMMIPMKGQYEQQCNAVSAARLGIQVLQKIDENFIAEVKQWVTSAQKIKVNFPDETAQIIANIISDYAKKS